MDDAQGATTTAPAAEPSPRTDRLELLQQLAGTVGVVHKARNPKLNRTVALRQVAIPEWLDDAADLIKRILAEARSASGLDHINIARLFTGGYKGFTVFLTSEFVDGPNIKEFLAARNLGVAEIISLGKQLCSALDYAHQRNVLHNALTPANLKVLPNGNLKILDFGLFRDKHLYAPNPAKRLESEHYLSPEQLKGKPVSQAANIFSMATILYEMLTTRNPFAGKHLGEVDRNITEIDPQPASLAHARVSEAISRVLMKGLAKHSLARFQSCAEFASALDDALKGGPIKAVSPAAAVPVRPIAPMNSTKVVQPQPVSNSGGSSAQAQVASAISSNGQLAPASGSLAPGSPTRGDIARDGVAVSGGEEVEARQVSSPAPVAPPPLPRPVLAAKPLSTASRKEPASKMPVKMLTQWKWVGGIVAALFVVSAVAISLNHRSKTPPPTPQPSIAAQTPGSPAGGGASRDGVEEPAPVQPQLEEPDPAPEIETPVITADEPQIRTTRKKPARMTAPVPAAATDGQLAVSSEPTGATFSIEGRTLDSWRTPQIVGSLAPAVYRVTVSKAGYASETRNIQVVGGKSVSLEVKLSAIKGTLAVRGTPLGARIVIDGKETGRFSPADFILDPAVHNVSLRKEGYFDSTESVKLAAGQTLNYSPSMMAEGRTDNIKVMGGGFKKLFGSGGSSEGKVRIEIKSDPKGAEVLINGSAQSKTTPLEIQLDPGNYEVILQKDGYKPVRTMVNAGATDRIKIDKVLQQR